MLGKLLKHEFRATARFMWVIYAAMLVLSIGSHFAIRYMDRPETYQILRVLAVMVTFLWVLALIFGVIGILNLTNVILTGAIARQSEFAVMRSIGMSRRQLRRLFVYEGLIYALVSGGAGIILAAALSLTAVRAIVGGWWFASYRLTVVPAVLAALVCTALAAGIAWGIDRMWNKGSIVEKLRRVE